MMEMYEAFNKLEDIRKAMDLLEDEIATYNEVDLCDITLFELDGILSKYRACSREWNGFQMFISKIIKAEVARRNVLAGPDVDDLDEPAQLNKSAQPQDSNTVEVEVSGLTFPVI